MYKRVTSYTVLNITRCHIIFLFLFLILYFLCGLKNPNIVINQTAIYQNIKIKILIVLCSRSCLRLIDYTSDNSLSSLERIVKTNNLLVVGNTTPLV